MRCRESYYHCGDHLLRTLAPQIGEIRDAIASVTWKPEFVFESQAQTLRHQAAYNRAFATEFSTRGWEYQPLLREHPRLIGDFRKHLVFVEVQFGNSATLFRDYYKFQYGLANGLLSLVVLVVPAVAREFFPTRPASVANMAEYSLAETCLTVLPIRVPTLLIGLLPEN
ncbi:MAG: hypothetical protein ACUVXG_02960 [Anaerolineae bacterium]